MRRSNGKQSGESVKSIVKKKIEGYGGKDLHAVGLLYMDMF